MSVDNFRWPGHIVNICVTITLKRLGFQILQCNYIRTVVFFVAYSILKLTQEDMEFCHVLSLFLFVLI